MTRGRIALIGVSVVLGMGGCWLMFKGDRGIGLGALLLGLAGLSLEMLRQRCGSKRDEAEQQEWIANVKQTADDLALEGYGISSLAELARYHDAEGRAAVLAALAALPAGRRALLTAARQVEPEAEWD